MPNLTPRKDEVRRVVEILESSDFETGEAMAKAIIKETYQILLERSWFALLWRTNTATGRDLSLSWGPFTSATEAERFAKKLEIGGTARALPLSSVAMMEAHVARTARGKAKNCPNCDHPIGTHLHERRMGHCMVRGCKCKSMTIKEEA